MRLSVADRLLLLELLPDQGDILTLRVRQDLISTLGLSDEERVALKFERDEVRGMLLWDHEAERAMGGPKQIALGESGRGMLAAALVDMNKAKHLRPEHVSLYERLVEGRVVVE